MKKLLVILLCSLLVPAAFSQADKDTTNLLKVGSDMPEFTLTSIDGKTITSDDLYGKVVLINFFATWCGPCMLEMPELNKDIWQKYKDNEDFVLLVVDREEKPEVIKAWVQKKKYDMPFYPDEKKEVYSLFATKFIPRNYLFDKESRLVLNSMGFKKEEFEVLKRQIGDLLK
jgi:peroxiredoxin